MRPWFKNLHPLLRRVVFIAMIPFLFVIHAIQNFFVGFGEAAEEIRLVWKEIKREESNRG